MRPGDLLKLSYGDLNRSDRASRLEEAFEVICLVRGLKPDLKKIADLERRQ